MDLEIIKNGINTLNNNWHGDFCVVALRERSRNDERSVMSKRKKEIDLRNGFLRGKNIT